MVDRIIEFQDDVIEAADRCLFQDVAATTTIDSTIIPITRRLGPVSGPIIFMDDEEDDSSLNYPITGTLEVGPCPNCHRHLKLYLTENGNHLQDEST
jgi:hypothetical protein